jgi:hypothetical protein
MSVQNIGQNAFDAPYVPYVLWMFAGLFMARHEQQARAVAAMAEGGSQRRIVARPLAAAAFQPTRNKPGSCPLWRFERHSPERRTFRP